MNPVRDEDATIACALCGRSFVPEGRQRYCGTTCRQRAWRRLHAAPVAPLVVVAKASTVYECDTCGNRYLGTQRCEDCNTFARKVGPGGCCPYCDEPVALDDIIDLDQMRPHAVESTRPNHVSNVSVQPGQPQNENEHAVSLVWGVSPAFLPPRPRTYASPFSLNGMRGHRHQSALRGLIEPADIQHAGTPRLGSLGTYGPPATLKVQRPHPPQGPP